MKEFIIDVSGVEELQTLKDVNGLEKIFARAKTTIVNGERVLLVRKINHQPEKFDEITTLNDLEQYRDAVFKYL
jgi:hypothetical protein